MDVKKHQLPLFITSNISIRSLRDSGKADKFSESLAQGLSLEGTKLRFDPYNRINLILLSINFYLKSLIY